MGTTRFGLTNRITTTCTVKNGSGGGAPAREEDAAYLMENVLYGDRNVIWRSAGGFGFNFDIDLGAARTLSGIGLHGVDGSAISCGFYYQTGVYTPGGTWTFLGSSSLIGVRDAGVAFASIASIRSVRFAFTASGVMSCGKFFAGLLTDLGRVGSPGMANNEKQNRSVLQMPSGAVFITSLGSNSREITIPLGMIPEADHDTVAALADQTGSFTMVDLDDAFYDVVLLDGLLPKEYASANLRNTAIRLLGLP